jgi:cytochrome c biogenesis protein CcmG, thiol:disulfide interchange protein DsbE
MSAPPANQASQQQAERSSRAAHPPPSSWPARIAIILAIIVTGGLALASCGTHARPSATPRAQAFSLPALASSGHHVSLSQYAGKPLIIEFCASWAPTCHRETKLLGHFYHRYHGEVDVIGIDTGESRHEAQVFASQAEVSYPVAVDQAQSVAARYGVLGVPVTYFVSSRHRIMLTEFGILNWLRLREGVLVTDGELLPPRRPTGRGLPAHS